MSGWKVGDRASISAKAPKPIRAMFDGDVGEVAEVTRHTLTVRFGNVRVFGMRSDFMGPRKAGQAW